MTLFRSCISVIPWPCLIFVSLVADGVAQERVLRRGGAGDPDTLDPHQRALFCLIIVIPAGKVLCRIQGLKVLLGGQRSCF